MLTTGIIFYQFAIILSLALARFFGAIFNNPGLLFLVAIGWTVWTVVCVFSSSLFFLQLLVIWVGTGLFAPKN